MINLIGYGDDELTLNVMNDAYFYCERHHRAYLMALIDEEFTYTPEQMANLIKTLDEEEEDEVHN